MRDVEARVGELVRGRAAPLRHGATALRFLRFDLVRGLPEEEIRRDRCPEHGHDGRHVDRIPTEARHERREGHLVPVGPSQERGHDVGKQDSGQPLEPLSEGRVGRVDRRDQNDEPEHGYRHDGRHAREHVGDVRHAGEVGRDVEDVGDQQQETRDVEKRARIVAADRGGQAAAADESDPRADELHRRHQRKGRQRHPEHPVPERGAGDGIGGDPARIVVRGAGHEPRSEDPEIADERIVTVPLDLLEVTHDGAWLVYRRGGRPIRLTWRA